MFSLGGILARLRALGCRGTQLFLQVLDQIVLLAQPSGNLFVRGEPTIVEKFLALLHKLVLGALQNLQLVLSLNQACFYVYLFLTLLGYLVEQLLVGVRQPLAQFSEVLRFCF